VTFAATSDTYRDLKPDGTWTYVAVAAGSKPPPVTSGALRVAVTTTDGASITGDRFLCSSSVPLWTPPGSMTIQ